MTPKAKQHVLDDVSSQIMTDALEMLSYRIVMDDNPGDADKQFESIEYFFRTLSDGRKYGRLYCFYRLAKIYTACCTSSPYPTDQGDDTEQSVVPLAKWSKREWSALYKSLCHLRDAMIRQDAEMLVECNEELHPERGKEDSVWYQGKLGKILRVIKIQQALERFRWSLEEQVRSPKEGRPEVNALHFLVSQSIEKDFEDDPLTRNALEALLVRSKRANTRSHGVSLVSLEELRKILQVVPFSLDKFQKKISRLLRYWMADISGDTPPVLVSLDYRGNPREPSSVLFAGEEDDEPEHVEAGAAVSEVERADEDEEDQDDENEEEEEEEDDTLKLHTQPPEVARLPDDSPAKSEHRPSSQKRKAQSESARSVAVDQDLENLKSVRATLHNDFEDPLEESRKIAASAVGVKRKKAPSKSPAGKKHALSINEKKPSATTVEFGDSESEEDEQGVKLSAVPKRAKLKSPRKKEEVVPDASFFKPDGTKRRKRFSEEEKTAIREGVRKFGVGKWAQIKSHYSMVLRNRTAVNIKDCYRTLTRNDDG